MLNPDTLPPLSEALYCLRYPGCNEAFMGATFKDGVTVAPVDSRTAKRLHQAFGAALTIELWEGSDILPRPAKQTAVADKNANLKAKRRPGRPDPFTSAYKDIKPDVLTKEQAKLEVAIIADNAGLLEDLDAMNKYELKDLAESMGLKPHWKAGAENLRKLIRDAQDKL